MDPEKLRELQNVDLETLKRRILKGELKREYRSLSDEDAWNLVENLLDLLYYTGKRIDELETALQAQQQESEPPPAP
jgi:hypothetical protein